MKKLNYLIVAAGLTGLLLITPYTICNVQKTATYQQNKDEIKAQETVINIETVQRLEDIIKNNENVAVDIGATWCGPCRGYSPIFEETAKEYKDKVVFCKVVLDKIGSKDEKKISQDYNVRYIPKTILFKNGKEVYSQFGGIEKENLKDLIEFNLLGKSKK